MKNIFSFFSFILALATAASAQTVVNVSGDITSSTTWTNDKIYTLGSVVYVNNGVTLTINPGTIIKGGANTALVIMRGAKIIAQGTMEQPIVFTSNKAAGFRDRGDWAGLVICGKARTNDVNGSRQSEGGIDPVKGTYGGTDDADNSGVLTYVRVEFAGFGFQTNSELNGITFNAVGSGTQVDHVQSSYANDDAFEWFGGTVKAKYLIAHRTLDDDFDTDYGFSGKLQFGLSVRDSLIADSSGSNGFESDNDANGSTNTPYTSPTFSNFTILGPKIRNNTPNQTISANYKRALHLRRSTKCSVFNSVFSGYFTGLKVENTTTATNYQNGDLMFANNVFSFTTGLLDSTGSGTTPLLSMNMANLFNSRNNRNLPALSDLGLATPNYTAPSLLPTVNSILLSGASFADAKLNDAFFTPTTYRGAFGTTDWTSCWAEFNPVNADYTTGINYFPQTISLTEGTTSIQATPGYSYKWSTGETTQSIVKPNSGTGQYSVTVTNARGCAKTTSILLSNENTDAPSIRLTPNPASGTLYVSLRNLENKGISVRIIDMTGRQLISEDNVNASNGLMAFDITSLRTGIYQVVLTQGNNTVTEKLIVQ
jgi:hypothetical protein